MVAFRKERDCAELVDYSTAYGKEASQHLSASMSAAEYMAQRCRSLQRAGMMLPWKRPASMQQWTPWRCELASGLSGGSACSWRRPQMTWQRPRLRPLLQ